MYFEMPNLEMSKIKKTLMTLTIFPLISFLVNIFLLTDSPRNLIVNNQKEKAFAILQSMNKKIEEYLFEDIPIFRKEYKIKKPPKF